MLKRLTDFTMAFAHHRHVQWWLFFYAIIESMFFPVPPDVLLIALALARSNHAQRFALIAAIGSVVGGVGGYMIGRFAFDPVAAPILQLFCTSPEKLVCPDNFITKLEGLFATHGNWVVAVSAMSAVIPYKFTILAAGMAKMALLPFTVISFVVHWFRYALVSFLVARYGKRAVHLVRDQLPIVFGVVGFVALAVYLLLHYI